MDRTEYAIVGGGIVGASIAYHLSERCDASVTVFEKGSVASETTTKSVAMVGLYGDRTQYSMKQYGLDLYNEFLSDPRAAPRYRTMGRLMVATTELGDGDLNQVATGRSSDQNPLTAGSGEDFVEYIPGDAVGERLLAPLLDRSRVVGAVYRPRVGYMSRPAELAHEFVERAKENGVSFRTGTPVTAIPTEDGTVTGVRTSDGHVASDHVVCAAGPWNVELARSVGLELPLRHTIAPVLELRPHSSIDVTHPSIEHYESGYSIHVRDESEVLVSYYPGSYEEAGTEYDPDSYGDTVDDDVRERALDVSTSLIPSLSEAEVVDEWVGIRSVTPDGNPIVGWTDVENFSIAGFSTSGIQLAPAVGDVVARQLLADDPTEYYDSLSIARFDGYTDVRH